MLRMQNQGESVLNTTGYWIARRCDLKGNQIVASIRVVVLLSIMLAGGLGAGLMAIFMERDIEVTDVSVQFLNQPPESISDRADFEVSNRTRSLATRFDAWVLPFLNVYALAGQATTDTSLRSRIVINRPIAPPIEVEISDDSSVDGPMLGLGLTAVIGGAAWFAMDSERTLTITEDLPLIGPTEVLVTQRPVDPVTYQLGFSLTVDRHWDVLVEAGTNFDDANMLVLSASYRF